MTDLVDFLATAAIRHRWRIDHNFFHRCREAVNDSGDEDLARQFALAKVDELIFDVKKKILELDSF